MFIAKFDSRNFEFMALGESADEAQKALVKGLEIHTEKMKIEPDWWTVDDFNIDECPVGGCLREHAVLSSPDVSVTNRVALTAMPALLKSAEMIRLIAGMQTEEEFEMSQEDAFATINSLIGSAREIERDMIGSELQNDIAGVVHEGLYSGQVMEVADGVVVQRVNRDGATVRHDAAKLSAVVQVGDVVEIKYAGGVGVVDGGKEMSAGVGR